MKLKLSRHLNKKLKPLDIQDIPKIFKLKFPLVLKQYIVDYGIAFFGIKMITMSYGMLVIRYTPSFDSKIKLIMAFSSLDLLGALFLPTLFIYNFFSLFLDSKTYGMRQTKTTYTFKAYDFKSSLYWSIARSINLMTFGLVASKMSNWAKRNTGHQMANEDFLYEDLLQDKSPVNLLHLVELNTVSEEENHSFDERIAA